MLGNRRAIEHKRMVTAQHPPSGSEAESLTREFLASNARRPIQITCAFCLGIGRFRHRSELPLGRLASLSGCLNDG